MKLRIQKGMFSWKLIDESGAMVAKISSNKYFGASKKSVMEKGISFIQQIS